MEFEINYLSFYVIELKDQDDKRYKHFQTLDHSLYEESPLKDFLDGELTKIAKRRVERHAKSVDAPTKIGRFIVEPGHELTSNPNYNQFHRVRFAASTDDFRIAADEIAQMYIETSAIREGALIIVSAKLTKFFDDPFIFILKCDFEQKVARITDEATLIHNVEMAITTKNMKSIQYPYMPEEGMMDSAELKVYQASHARYFEDFLKFVAYEKAMPEIVRSQVVDLVHAHIEEAYPEDSEEKTKFEEAIAEWAITPKRELQERFTTEEVIEATSHIVESAPEVELKMKLDHHSVRSMLSDFGDTVHLAKANDRYVLLIEAEAIHFEKGFSPIEFHKPEQLETVVKQLLDKE
ncbi:MULTISPECIES: DUF3900 domain-containing protein [unclassified Virgibacillus]|uniref:DUF3900 domain-containing protein n=1 Tax=unclassified Virgibacillus TaxID=2620237 RepID=UPI0024DEC347|nr:DUF3900 domain-containing protein [Virgibacillus sp. LDC-1]